MRMEDAVIVLVGPEQLQRKKDEAQNINAIPLIL